MRWRNIAKDELRKQQARLHRDGIEWRQSRNPLSSSSERAGTARITVEHGRWHTPIL